VRIRCRREHHIAAELAPFAAAGLYVTGPDQVRADLAALGRRPVAAYDE
jgi:hypothetical protein